MNIVLLPADKFDEICRGSGAGAMAFPGGRPASHPENASGFAPRQENELK
ncbi:hypothetical protein [Bradyrhizobium sp. dw_78]|nr:hypothetical protein [Bradyrhizobium sp. dw_78]